MINYTYVTLIDVRSFSKRDIIQVSASGYRMIVVKVFKNTRYKRFLKKVIGKWWTIRLNELKLKPFCESL